MEGNIIGDGEAITITPSVTDGILNIPFGDINKAYKINYKTTTTDEDISQYRNNATLTDDNLEPVSANADVTIQRGQPLNKEFQSYDNEETGMQELTNSYTPEETSITATKNWQDADNQENDRPDTIELQLVRIVDGEREAVGSSEEVSIDNNWTYTWTGLDKNYDGEPIEYTVEEVIDEEYGSYETTVNDEDIGNIIITNTRTYETEHRVVKGWVDGENQDGIRPDSINVQLLRNDKALGELVSVTEENNWIHTWENLEKYDGDNEAYSYSVIEVNVAEGYDAEVNAIQQFPNTSIITNTHVPDVIEVSGEKIWEDGNNQDGIRPNIIAVNLLVGDEVIADTVATAANDWTYNFENLPKYNNGIEIDYTIEEAYVPEGYEASYNNEDHENMVITNTYVPEETEVAVSKVWEDAENQDGVRPNNVTVNLLNGSEIVTSAVLNEENDWQHTFTDLPAYNNGTEINYTVTENTVIGYSTSLETTETDAGLNSVVTNTYTPETTTATVTKQWNDNNNQDGNRPNSVEVQLLANGEPDGEPVEVIAADNWTYTWNGLDLNANGVEINYTVEEVNVADGYEASYNNENRGNMVIYNAYTPEVTEVSVSKVWDDADNQDGVRPENVTINLLADGEIERSTIVNAEGEWQHTFTDLPVYNNGTEINYTITENTVTDYTTNIVKNPTVENEFVVTNSHTPNQTSVTVTKSWNDSNNQDGNRLDSVEFQLTANGEPQGEPVEVTTENWTYTWSGLDANADGEVIEYSVVELNVPEAYEVTVNDSNHGNIIITNTYAPELIDIPVLKVWDDSDNQDRVRPDRVEVNLLSDGVKIQEAHITEETDWQYVFTDLPKYKEGQEVVYTLNENNVEGYSLTNNELNEETGMHELTNSYTPEETSVTVTKAWNDNNNDDRSDLISVQLLANGEPQGEPVEVTAEDNWTHTWTGLALNSDGEAINYTVEEIEVTAGYEVSYNNEDHGNLIITNTSIPRVSVGDYVWIDANKDGLQDDTDIPLEGVELILTDSEGNPVTDVFGNPVGPTTTDENGYYTFDNLPIDNVYTVTINKEKFEELYPELSPTKSNVGEDNSIDSSTWTVDSVFLDEDGQRDPTLDFGFVKPSVSVGDYVWIDENRDGLQDETDTPLEGVELILTDSEGNPVTDVFGNPVGPTTTDENGYYTFDNLPIDAQYIVSINREKFEALYPELSPTLSNVGNDNSLDSSTWIATSIFLDEDGQRDPTLDFGFVTPEPSEPGKPSEPGEPADPKEPSQPGEPVDPAEPGEDGKPGAPGKDSEPGQPGEDGKPGKGGKTEDPKEENLPDTGEAQNTTLYLGGFMALLAGAALIFITRRKNNEEQ